MSQQPVIRLKELLFEKEARDIDALAERLDALHQRTGDDERLRASVARVIEGALRDAETVRHRELADALAPVVVRTVKAEIVSPDTQDKIAGSLYTKIGEMVRRYVSSAMRDLLEGINKRLESGLTHNRFMLKLRSLASGRSMAELALERSERLKVEEVYLIRRGSGELVHRWQAPSDQDMLGGSRNRDVLISGFLTAITAFAEEAFEGDKESLRAIDLDAHRVFLRGSPSYLVAAKCRGAAPREIEALLDAELLRLLDEQAQAVARYGADADAMTRVHDRVLADFTQRFESGATLYDQTSQRKRGGFGLVKFFAWLIILPLVGYSGWNAWLGHKARLLQAEAEATIEKISELRGYPIDVRVAHGAESLRVQGLTPTEQVRQRLSADLRQIAPGVRIKEFLAVVPQSDPTRAIREEATRSAVSRAEHRLVRLAADLSGFADRLVDDGKLHDVARLAHDRVVKLAAELQALRSRPQDGGDTIAKTIETVIAALSDVETRLSGFASLVPGGAPPVSPTADPIVSAEFERLSLITDRIGRLAITIELAHRAAAEQAKAIAPLKSQIVDLAARLEALKTEPSPRQKLEAFIKSNAVFFTNASDYRDAAAAQDTLDQLAKLILGAPGWMIRIIGYTDDVGGLQSQRNQALSQQRADQVLEELARRGVPRDRLVSVGRSASLELAPKSSAGATPANRRVEFEIGFSGEDAIRP